MQTTTRAPWWLVLSVAVIWLIGGSASAASRTPKQPQTTSPAATKAQRPTEDVGSLETYEGTPVGFTRDGAPFRGDPKAPLTLVEYSDYLCPFCGRYFHQTLPALLDKYARSGQVQFVFHDFPLAALHPAAPRGAAAASCVAEQGAARFWKMHDKLFREQRLWGRQPDPTPFLTNAARDSGADMTAYEQCMATGQKDAVVEQRVAAGHALGFNGTPSFQFVHHASGKTYTMSGAQPVSVFTQWIDALLTGKEPPQPQQAQKGELPLWAKPEGLAPDPQRPGFTLAGDAYKGNPEAKLIVVEFSDFECPACQRHALDTQPALDKQFVDTKEVLWVAKHFPMRSHANAPAAAVAAECAGEQGQFWGMHHLLFEKMSAWAAEKDPDTALAALAKNLKLDMPRFKVCLASRKALEHVLHDLYDAQSIVRSTPTFILIHDGKGHVLRGSRSVEQFVAMLQKRLENVTASN